MKKQKFFLMITSLSVLLFSGCYLEVPPTHAPAIDRYGVHFSFESKTSVTNRLYGLALGGEGHYCDSILINFLPFVTYYENNYGVSCNVMSMSCGSFNGIYLAAFSTGLKVNGLAAALVGGDGESGAGVSFALLNGWNTRGLQFGIVNMTMNSGVNATGVCNFHSSEETGCRPIFFGLFNYADKKSKCVQIGLINYCKSAFFPIFPLVNFY